MTAEDIYHRLLEWTREWKSEYSIVLQKNRKRAIEALNIGRNMDKVRKDLVNWKQTCQYMKMYFDETFKIEDEFPISVSGEDRKLFLKYYLDNIDFHDNKETWFDKIKKYYRVYGICIKYEGI